MAEIEAIIQDIMRGILEWSPRLLAALAIFFIGRYIVNRIDGFVRKKVGASTLNETVKPFLLSLISGSLKVILIVIIAAVIGIQTTSFVAVFGALVFAVGMALQGTLGHIASGFLLLIFRPYKVGDYITLGEHSGYVTEIQIINTIILSLDNEEVIIPNGMAIGDVIVNSTGDDGFMRFNVEVFIPYETRFTQVELIIKEAISKCTFVEQEKESLVGIGAFESHSIKVDVKCYCFIKNYENALYDLRRKIGATLGDHGIRVAYSEGVELGSIGGT